MTRSAALMEAGDVSKQHLRALSDAVRRAEASLDNIILRQHVKECAEKLIFALPLEFGTQGEDHLWKKAFYEPFARFKAKRNQMSRAQQLAIEQLLLSGLGTYQQILSRLELDFGTPLAGIVDVSLSRSNVEKTVGRRMEEFPLERRVELQEWALKCAYRCLLALGDLSRYLHDLTCQRKNGNSPHRSAAFRYYHQATLTRSSQGQPYNQLGTLTTGELAGLKEVYFYFRCLLCSEPFMGAKNNLNMSFDKNRAALAMTQGGVPSGGWESGVRTLLLLAELLWQGDVPKANMVNYVLRIFHYDQPLRCDVQFYALLVLLALDQKLTRNTAKKVGSEKSAAWVVVRDLFFALGGRICRELHHRLCLRICSKHPFNEKINNNYCHEATDDQQENNNCIIPTSRTNGSSGDSGSGSVRRHSAKPKIVRRRRAFGDGDSDEEDDNGGRGAGDGGQYENGTIEINSSNETRRVLQETEQPKMSGGTMQNINGHMEKNVQRSRYHTNLSGESSDSISSSVNWSSSSDDDSEFDDVASDDASDSDAPKKLQNGTSEKENLGNRERGGGGKMLSARLSPSYTLNKALSCKQLVKQVASEELLPAAKLFLDWLMLLSNNTCRNQTAEDDMNNKKTQVDLALPLRIVKYVADLANLLCVIKYRVMFGSDSTIEHVRSRLNDLTAQRNNLLKKHDNSSEEPTDNAKSFEALIRKELILPEDVHFPLEAAPALRTSTIYKKDDDNATAVHNKYDWVLSWGERSSLATEGQRAVYRMHLIADRAADICKRVEGATVIREQRITFEQKLQEKIAENILKEATPSVEMSLGTSGNGRQSTRGRNGRGNSVRGTRGERGAGDTEKQQVMMKSMAHAWLRHEVEGLEERLEGSAARNGALPLSDMNGICANSEGNISQRGGGGSFNTGIGGTVVGGNGSMYPMVSLSPFVVVDSSALSTRLASVRAIASQKRSILAVPTCVLSHLDEMKKDVAQARDATRWLETEMRKGSRFVQVLGPGEASKISLLKYPKRKDREAWHLFQLLECCHHLGNGGAINHGIAGKHGKQDGSHRTFRARGGIAAIQSGAVLVSLLIARAESDLPSNAATLADAIGVKLVDVDDLFGKIPSARQQLSIANKSVDIGTVSGMKSATASSVPTIFASLENGKHNASSTSNNSSTSGNETDRIKHAGG
ncbi:protein SMG5-like [Tropilaelaps mercedesae]|uniref:Protein SMG5-like n=1 Tax=Tropilaelaps mercedesae TaxID=418985 RepID=A0A1V9Y0N8_9ACAR|nr:protein SMG5-like [Tropilaelaps mercedesae]